MHLFLFGVILAGLSGYYLLLVNALKIKIKINNVDMEPNETLPLEQNSSVKIECLPMKPVLNSTLRLVGPWHNILYEVNNSESLNYDIYNFDCKDRGDYSCHFQNGHISHSREFIIMSDFNCFPKLCSDQMPEKHFAELGSAKTINLCVKAEENVSVMFQTLTNSLGRISGKTRKVATYVQDVIVTIENITETDFAQHTIYIGNSDNQLETKLTLYKKTPPELCGNTSSPLVYPVEIGATRVIPLCITSEDILSCTVTESSEEITDKVRCTIENKTLTNQTLTLTFTNITTSNLTTYTFRVTGNQTSFTDLTVILKDTTSVVARDNSNKTTPFNTPLSTTLGILLPVVFLLPAVALFACIVYGRTGRIKQMLQATLCKSKLDVSFNNCSTEDQGEGRYISNGLTYVTIEPSKSTHPKHKTRRKPKTEKVIYATLDFPKSSR